MIDTTIGRALIENANDALTRVSVCVLRFMFAEPLLQLIGQFEHAQLRPEYATDHTYASGVQTRGHGLNLRFTIDDVRQYVFACALSKNQRGELMESMSWSLEAHLFPVALLPLRPSATLFLPAAAFACWALARERARRPSPLPGCPFVGDGG